MAQKWLKQNYDTLGFSSLFTFDEKRVLASSDKLFTSVRSYVVSIDSLSRDILDQLCEKARQNPSVAFTVAYENLPSEWARDGKKSNIKVLFLPSSLSGIEEFMQTTECYCKW